MPQLVEATTIAVGSDWKKLMNVATALARRRHV
jgi:hypothetical protein